MSLDEYLLKNGGQYREGHMYSDQCLLIEKQIDWSRVKSVLEIGFNAGHSSDFFLSHPDVTVTSFELAPQKHTLLGKEYIDTKYPERHDMVWGDSTQTLPRYSTHIFDIIFIDGGHEVEVARADLVNCMRFAHKDTYVIMDDVVYEHMLAATYTVGPTRAWRELISISVLEETFHVDLSDGRGMSIGQYKVFHDFSVTHPKVVDAFMFYNELEMLKYRLTVMDPYVDQFVICECPVSFTGKTKPLYFQENKHLFEQWLHKIKYITWEGYRIKDAWYNENTQRNYLLKGLQELDPNDIVIISDVDEIIDPRVLKDVDAVLGFRPIIALSMDLYYYDIEHKLDDRWTCARIARYGFVRNVTPHMCRNTTRVDPVVQDAGWHLSYFGNEKFIINKTKNYAHTEASEFFEENDIEQVQKLIKKGIALTAYSNQNLSFIPKHHNTRLPPRLDILPHQNI